MIIRLIIKLLIIWYLLYIYFTFRPIIRDLYEKVFLFTWVDKIQTDKKTQTDTDNTEVTPKIKIGWYEVSQENIAQLKTLICK
jgi:hypothetical protein